MVGWPSSMSRVVDLAAVTILTVLALIVTTSSYGTALAPVVGVLFLLFAPGYAVVVAMFPHRRSSINGNLLFGLENLLLGVAISIGLSIVVGVNLQYTVWDIAAVPVVGILSSITLLATSVATYRRLSHRPETLSASPSKASYDIGSRTDGDKLHFTSIVVATAVLVAVLSVGVVALDPPRGERYTEFGLLTEADNGTFVADNYPSEMSLGETSTMYFTVTNREMQTKEYAVVIMLVKTNEDGEAIKRSQLNSFWKAVDTNKTWRQEHAVEPVMTGEKLRLTYLLYDGTIPDQPTVQNSYRELHIWIDIT